MDLVWKKITRDKTKNSYMTWINCRKSISCDQRNLKFWPNKKYSFSEDNFLLFSLFFVIYYELGFIPKSIEVVTDDFKTVILIFLYNSHQPVNAFFVCAGLRLKHVYVQIIAGKTFIYKLLLDCCSVDQRREQWLGDGKNYQWSMCN